MTSCAQDGRRPHETDRNRLLLLKELGFEPRSFFDVGASNGCWSKRVGRAFPEATFDLFEPLAEGSEQYRRRLGLLLDKQPRFRLHKLALGAECRKVRMFLPPNVDGSTALDLGAYAPAEWASQEVDMVTLDYVVQEFRVAPPDVLKIDTQGCELNVLQGARQNLAKVQLLVLECWLTRSYGPATPLLLEVAQWLREFDFHLWDFGDGWRNPSGALCSRDCFFLNARCPVSRLSAEERRFPKAEPAGLASGQQPWLRRMRMFLAGLV